MVGVIKKKKLITFFWGNMSVEAGVEKNILFALVLIDYECFFLFYSLTLWLFISKC